jgi:hypothetical protein
MIHIDNLDGEGTIFINTDDGTKSIGHVEEEYVDIMQDVLKEVKRLREENNRYEDFIFWLGIEHKGKKLAWEYGDEKLAEML